MEFFSILPYDMKHECVLHLSPHTRTKFASSSKESYLLIKNTRTKCNICGSREFACCDRWIIDKIFKNQFMILGDYGYSSNRSIRKYITSEEIIGLYNVMESWYKMLKPQMTKDLIYFILELCVREWFLPCFIKNSKKSYFRISTKYPAITFCMINEENSYFLRNNPLQYYKKK